MSTPALPDRIRDYLHAKRARPRDLAARIGVHERTAYRWMEGSTPRLIHAIRLAELLDIGVRDVVSGVEGRNSTVA